LRQTAFNWTLDFQIGGVLLGVFAAVLMYRAIMSAGRSAVGR
jgi:hypothetical protein